MQFELDRVRKWSSSGQRTHDLQPRFFKAIHRLYDEGVPISLVQDLLKTAYPQCFDYKDIATRNSLFWFLNFKPIRCSVCDSRVLSFVRQTRSSPPWCSVSCKNKDEANKLYGSQNHSTRDEVKGKIRKAFSKYQGGHPLRDPSVKKKLRDTCLERYGVENPRSSKEVKDKIKKTTREIYGVDHHMQDAATASRILNSGFSRKRCVLLGRVHYLQGCEPDALRSISHKLKKIETDAAEMPEIWYMYRGTRRRYYPDAVVTTKTGRKFVIEAKSDWTLVREGERNLAKLAALRKWCSRNSCGFALYVSKKKGQAWFVSPTAKECRNLIQAESVGKSKIRWKE